MNHQSFDRNNIYGSIPNEIEGVDTLAELALDLEWSWNHTADELWQWLDNDLWEKTHNPWIVLQSAPRDKLQKLLTDETFKQKINEILASRELDKSRLAWFQHKYPDSPLTCIAYFSMEFMLTGALPIYVGGLGNVAGDQLKSASDLLVYPLWRLASYINKVISGRK